MSPRKFLALIGGIVRELVEVEVTFVTFTLKGAAASPVVVVKEKVESVEFDTATTSVIRMDDAKLYTVLGSVATTKATLSAA
jgi:hypothetical protein